MSELIIVGIYIFHIKRTINYIRKINIFVLLDMIYCEKQINKMVDSRSIFVSVDVQVHHLIERWLTNFQSHKI